MQVTIQPFRSEQMDELLAFLKKWSPTHPELGEGSIIRWQKCHQHIAMVDNRIVGYIAQIPHEFHYGKPSNRSGGEQIGWGVTFVVDTSDNEIRKQAGRGLLTVIENSPPMKYTGVGMVAGVDQVYIRRGHVIRKDSVKMYGRFFKPTRALKYLGKSTKLAPAIKLANFVFPAQTKVNADSVTKFEAFLPEWDTKWDELLSERYELYGIRDAVYLNYKLSQPNREYFCYRFGIDGYLIFRRARNDLRDLTIVKVCDLVGTEKAKAALLPVAMRYAIEHRVDGILAISSVVDEPLYKSDGMFIARPYPIMMSPTIKVKMHVSFFDSDMDNLW
ncbi:MAG: hypothetical protein SGI97_01410 [candidate division Zixibacteria bacterium]|nr:hypothetical protein [candidate division Zixibacteria bacterium]